MSRASAPITRHSWGETRLLMDYLQAAYPGRVWHTNVRVGPIAPHVPRDGLTEAQRAIMGSYRRYADAVVPFDRELIVIETTVLKAIMKVGPLLEYLKLVPQTDEHPEWATMKLRGELVSPIPDPRAQELCGETGLRFVYFQVSWLDQYFDQHRRRFREAPLSHVRQEFLTPP